MKQNRAILPAYTKGSKKERYYLSTELGHVISMSM